MIRIRGRKQIRISNSEIMASVPDLGDKLITDPPKSGSATLVPDQQL
jgi:hypothetical protein